MWRARSPIANQEQLPLHDAKKGRYHDGGRFVQAEIGNIASATTPSLGRIPADTEIVRPLRRHRAALRLGHRRSEDFDFFTTESFDPVGLLGRLPYLKVAVVAQIGENSLTCTVERQGGVQVSFFGGLGLRRIHEPDPCPGNGVRVAALLDLAGCKVGVVQQRAQAKDYLDNAGIIRAGVDLPTALAAGRAVYGAQFDPAITLRALTSFDEGNLGQVL